RLDATGQAVVKAQAHCFGTVREAGFYRAGEVHDSAGSAGAPAQRLNFPLGTLALRHKGPMLRSFPLLPLLVCAALSVGPAVVGPVAVAQERSQEADEAMAALPAPPPPSPQENVRIEF